MDTKLGSVVLITRGYTIAEVFEAAPSGGFLGYSVFGHGAEALKIYPDKDSALLALQTFAGSAS